MYSLANVKILHCVEFTYFEGNLHKFPVIRLYHQEIEQL